MSRATTLLCALGIAIASVACSETDAGVTTKVKVKFAADDTVKAYQIDVDTANKVVTLKGNVETLAAKTMAVQIARDTEGVASVVDQLTVTAKPMAPVDTPNLPNQSDVTDPAITAAVKTRLLADPDVAGLKIDVDTQSGMVTLTGTVKTAAEKAEAMSIARGTTGVKGVNDKLTVGR